MLSFLKRCHDPVPKFYYKKSECLYPTILIQGSSEDPHLNTTVLRNSPENTEIHRPEEFPTPTSLRYRENIRRIRSLRVFE